MHEKTKARLRELATPLEEGFTQPSLHLFLRVFTIVDCYHTSVIGSWLMAIHVFNDGHSENGNSKFETRERDLNLTLTALQSFLFDH